MKFGDLIDRLLYRQRLKKAQVTPSDSRYFVQPFLGLIYSPEHIRKHNPDLTGFIPLPQLLVESAEAKLNAKGCGLVSLYDSKSPLGIWCARKRKLLS